MTADNILTQPFSITVLVAMLRHTSHIDGDFRELIIHPHRKYVTYNWLCRKEHLGVHCVALTTVRSIVPHSGFG